VINALLMPGFQDGFTDLGFVYIWREVLSKPYNKQCLSM
jgi:hypothetical protein